MTGWGREPSKRQVRFLFPASQGPAISPSLVHLPGSAFLFPTPRKAKLSCSARLVSSERRHLLSTCGALGIFPGRKAASLPLLPLLTLSIFTVQGVLRPLAGRWCLRPFSSVPAPRSTCARVCDTALTSVGASSQSGARTRSPANPGRGLWLSRQEANEGQCPALCNPPPGPTELPLR